MTKTVTKFASAEKIREIYDRGFWRDDTIYSLVRHNGTVTPDKVAFRERYRIVTYGELLDAADYLSCTLHKTGLSADERVAVWLPSRVTARTARSTIGWVCALAFA